MTLLAKILISICAIVLAIVIFNVIRHSDTDYR